MRSRCTCRSRRRRAARSPARCSRRSAPAPSSSTPPGPRWWTRRRCSSWRAPAASGSGTDVFAGEPEKGQADFQSELGKLPNVYGTHHIGASTAQAQDAIARETVRIVASFLRTGRVPNCVNVARKTPARARLVIRHFDKVGVLANVLGLIREAGINVEEVQNTVFEEAQAASCAIDLDEAPPPELLERIRARKDEILFVDKVEL